MTNEIRDFGDLMREEEDKALAEAKRSEPEWQAGAQKRRVRRILEMRRMRRNGCIEDARNDEEE